MCFVQFSRATDFSSVKMICSKWFLGKFLAFRSCLQGSNIRTNSGVKNGDAEAVQPVHWFFFFLSFFCPRARSGNKNTVKPRTSQWQSIYIQNHTIFQAGRHQKGSPSETPCSLQDYWTLNPGLSMVQVLCELSDLGLCLTPLGEEPFPDVQPDSSSFILCVLYWHLYFKSIKIAFPQWI